MKRLICAVFTAALLTLGVSADADAYDELIMNMSVAKTVKFQYELMHDHEDGDAVNDDRYSELCSIVDDLYIKLAPAAASRELLETLPFGQTYTVDGITMTDFADFADAYGDEYDVFAVYRAVDGYEIYDITVQNKRSSGGLYTSVGGDGLCGTEVLGDDSNVCVWEDILFAHTVGYAPAENRIEVFTSRDTASGVTTVSGHTKTYKLRIDGQSDMHFVFVDGVLAYMYNTAAVSEWHDYCIVSNVGGVPQTDSDSFAGTFDCYPRYYNTRMKRAVEAYMNGTLAVDPLGSYTRTVTADGGTVAVFTLGFECPTDGDMPLYFLADDTPRSYMWVATAGGAIALLGVFAAVVLKRREAK